MIGAPASAAAGFAAAMARLGPFEPRPHLAIGCSGGADSLALAVLLRDWTAARGGQVTALTVDHGLRPEAAAEARLTGKRLASLGIEQEVLVWQGEKPASGLQAAARTARYDLLIDWCRKASVLHLFLAHQRRDQAETLLLRSGKGSGSAGLSGMALERCLPDLRLLRPLLDVAPAGLKDLLKERGIDWAEDPSNQDRRFTRVRLRQDLAAGPAGREIELAAAARGHGLRRDRREQALAKLLALHCQVDAAGWLALDRDLFAGQPQDRATHLLARVLMTIGGGIYPPRGGGLARLLGLLREGCEFRRTLGGCLLEARRDVLRVFREVAPARSLPFRGRRIFWDGRFILTAERPVRGIRIAALGEAGWAELRRQRADKSLASAEGLPHPARLAVPGLWDDRGLAAVPLFGWQRSGGSPAIGLNCRFRPNFPLAAGSFIVVPAERHII